MRIDKRVQETSQDASAQPKGRERERGVALLLVLTLIVMFSAFSADFSYQSRVRYTMASHARDAARARALAVGGMRTYLMLVKFGDQLLNQLNSAFGGGATGLSVIQVIPCIDTGMLRMMNGGDTSDSEEPLVAAAPGGTAKGPTEAENAKPVEEDSLLAFDGDFNVCASDESSKISLNGLALNPSMESPGFQLLLRVLERDEYQAQFREMDITPQDLVTNIVDWVDVDGERLNRQGYEDNLYNRMADPYNSKNAGYDSLSELHLVAGMTDEFFAVIAPLVTAYTTVDKVTLPVNSSLMLGALVAASLPNVRFSDADLERLWEQYNANLNGTIPSSAQALVDYLKTLDPKLGSLDASVMGTFVTNDRNAAKIYRLVSTGRVNGVSQSIEAIVNVTENPNVGGNIYYWREE